MIDSFKANAAAEELYFVTQALTSVGGKPHVFHDWFEIIFYLK